MLAYTLLVSALLPFVAAQQLELEAIQAHFNQSRIVPDLFATFNPTSILDVKFNGQSITPGQKFTKEQVAKSPQLSVEFLNSTSGKYTLTMLDAEAPGTNLGAGENRHWLLYGVSVGQDQGVSNATATTITPYAGPGPAPGSGPHRYVICLYDQPQGFAPPQAFAEPGLGVSRMDWPGFVGESHLGNLIAANYIQVEEGTATGSIVPTSSVISSTLAPVSAAASSAPSGAATGTTTGSGSTGSGNGASAMSAHLPVAIALAALTAFLA